MILRQRRLLGWTLLLAFAALGATWLLRLDYAEKISTDVLDLIPVNEREPELAVVRSLASEAEARTMLFVLTRDDATPAPIEVAQSFATELTRGGAFNQAIALGDPSWRDSLGRELFELRFSLLFPLWLRGRDAATLPADVAKNLKSFLQRPEALAFQDLVPADPLLLLPDALERMKQGLALVQPANATAPSTGLVWAQLAASPLSEAGQRPAFEAIERAAKAAGVVVTGGAPRAGERISLGKVEALSTFRVAYTGVNRFAAASRDRIEREVSWLNTLSLVAVLAVACVFIRAVHRALHLLPVIGFAVLGAWVATTMIFERVHVIVFVLGALLTGVAIDYGFYLFMQPPARADEDYWEKVRRLAKPLLASCFTTVVGFALLLFSELPMIRQLGVFVGVGLLCALGSAVVYFSTVRDAFLAPRTFRVSTALRPDRRRLLRRGFFVCWGIALLGLVRVSWHDDIRELEIPAPALRAEDERIRAAFGQRGDRTVYLTYGATLDEARLALGKLESWIAGRATLANLTGIIPAPTDRENARRFFLAQGEFLPKLRAALEAEGFAADEFAPFFNAFAKHAAQARSDDADDAVRRLQAALRGPLGLLLHTGAGKNWFVTLASRAPAEPPPPETKTLMASQLESLNRLFSSYRASAMRLSLGGLALVGLGVFLTYGLRDGMRIFAIPCGACLGIFGVLGWLGQPLNLFHLLGAFLGVCLTHNYSIFSATSVYHREPPPVSVRLSALTTAASFGALALSGIPVVRALGVTVTAMVLAALVAIELEHLAPLARKS